MRQDPRFLLFFHCYCSDVSSCGVSKARWIIWRWRVQHMTWTSAKTATTCGSWNVSVQRSGCGFFNMWCLWCPLGRKTPIGFLRTINVTNKTWMVSMRCERAWADLGMSFVCAYFLVHVRRFQTLKPRWRSLIRKSMRRTSKPWRSRANDVLERLCWVGWFSFRYLGQVFLRYLRNMNVAQVFEGLGPFFLELSAICEPKVYQSSTIHAISIHLTASSFCLFVTCRFSLGCQDNVTKLTRGTVKLCQVWTYRRKC